MKKEFILNKEKAFLFINAIIFNLAKLIPARNKNIWVFGAVSGNKFDDNTCALFEYINNKQKNIRCIWLASSDCVVTEVRNKGYECYLSNSYKGIWYSLRAGVSIYTHSLYDFGSIPFVGGSTIVCLWHGVGFKKVYNYNYKGLSLAFKRFIDFFFSKTYRDVTISTSKYVNYQHAGSFNLKKNHPFYIAGQPRNDILKENLKKEDILSNVKIDYSKKVILYMPTWRGKSMGHDAMSNIIFDLYNSKELNDILTSTNSVFVVKLHPQTPPIINIKNRNNFYILNYNQVENTQELLGVADILISDYSSCSVDFALLNRPVIFYMPDKEKFEKETLNLYDEFYELCKYNQCTNPKELVNFIKNPSNTACDAINNLFEDASIKETCYSENVYNAIIKEIGL